MLRSRWAKATKGGFYLLVVIVALALLAVRFVEASFLQGTDDFPERERVRVTATEPKRDFMFQINGYMTENQGGQKLNVYFHYRYDAGVATSDIPNYEDLRAAVLESSWVTSTLRRTRTGRH